MRKAIAVATVAGLILGAASVSAVSAQGWSIGFEGIFNNNFGGGFKGGVSSPVADTVIVKTMPKFVTNTVVTFGSEFEKVVYTEVDDQGRPISQILRDSTWWDTVTTSDNVGGITNDTSVVMRKAPDTKEMFTPHVSGGGGVFFASKYAEASVGLAYLGGTWKRTVVGKNSVEPVYIITKIVRDSVKNTIVRGDGNESSYTYSSKSDTTEEKKKANDVSMNSQWVRDVKAFNINIGAWLKYPYELSDAVKIFPLAGIEYEICTIITSEMRNLTEANSWSRTWFKAGVGGDFYLSERIYLHPVVLYGVGWKNSVERGIMKDAGISGETKISHGLAAKVGIGYMFNLD